ncbi:MAG TPA: PAS domain-containing protein [Longimicrobium sp.]
MTAHGDTEAQSENAEREAAYERGRLRRLGEPTKRRAIRERVRAANPALAALAENVRDYAIFLLDPDGVITYWGEGAHLLKWWTLDEAEGAHLRLLYPEGGSDDGTAEEHLRQAAESGEYVGEGCRVRRDQSTFWAHVSLTALRSPGGELFGFVKLTRDMTARRAADAALAAAIGALTDRDHALAIAREAEAARQRAEEAAEFERARALGATEYMRHRDTEAQR